MSDPFPTTRAEAKLLGPYFERCRAANALKPWYDKPWDGIDGITTRDAAYSTAALLAFFAILFVVAGVWHG